MQALLNPNKVEEISPALQNLTTDAFAVSDEYLFGQFANAITVKNKDELSLINKLELQNVKSFQKLEANWDSYNAAPVEITSIEKAIDFIKNVNVFGIDVYLTSPGPNGEVLVQLKNRNQEIEFIFYSSMDKFVQFDDDNFISQGDFNYDKLENLIAWLYEEGR